MAGEDMITRVAEALRAEVGERMPGSSRVVMAVSVCLMEGENEDYRATAKLAVSASPVEQGHLDAAADMLETQARRLRAGDRATIGWE